MSEATGTKPVDHTVNNFPRAGDICIEKDPLPSPPHSLLCHCHFHYTQEMAHGFSSNVIPQLFLKLRIVFSHHPVPGARHNVDVTSGTRPFLPGPISPRSPTCWNPALGLKSELLQTVLTLKRPHFSCFILILTAMI